MITEETYEKLCEKLMEIVDLITGKKTEDTGHAPFYWDKEYENDHFRFYINLKDMSCIVGTFSKFDLHLSLPPVVQKEGMEAMVQTFHHLVEELQHDLNYILKFITRLRGKSSG